MNSTDNVIYASKFYFGSYQNEANLVFDSQNDYMLVNENDCETCYSQVYNFRSLNASAGYKNATPYAVSDLNKMI